MKTCCQEKGYNNAFKALMHDDSIPRVLAARMQRLSSSKFEKSSKILGIGSALKRVA